VLTFARLAMVPAFVGLWFDGGACAWRPPAAAAVFIAAAVTDWADGYLARRVSWVDVFFFSVFQTTKKPCF
jgi:phosphatidylglycerophosphate synthase